MYMANLRKSSQSSFGVFSLQQAEAPERLVIGRTVNHLIVLPLLRESVGNLWGAEPITGGRADTSADGLYASRLPMPVKRACST